MKISSIIERVSLPVPTGVAGSAVPAILVGLFVALGGILFGYVCCVYHIMICSKVARVGGQAFNETNLILLSLQI